MTKFWAILKDSYRESVDGGLFRVMLGLAGLLLLFVASISFKPITLQDAIENKFIIPNAMLRNNPAFGSPQITVENFAVTNGAAEAWNADYRLDFVVTCSDPAGLDNARKSGLPVTASAIRGMMGYDFYYLTNPTVTEVPNQPPGVARFTITTRGTKVTEERAWPHQPTLLFAVPAAPLTASLRDGVYRIEKTLVNDVGAVVLLLVGVVVTAGFVPNMLRKGTVDLYLAKPLGRWQLLVYKYLGGLTFVFLLAAVTVAGVWAVVGLRTGLWAPEFLALVPAITAYFAILYAVSTCVGVFTRSALLAILATLLAWLFFFGAGWVNSKFEEARRAEQQFRDAMKQARPTAGNPEGSDEADGSSMLGVPKWVRTGVQTVYLVLPRGYDLDTLAGRAIARGVLTEPELKQRQLTGPAPSLAATATSSVLFVAAVLALACWRFSARDY